MENNELGLPPRKKLQRRDWARLNAQLHSYYDDLLQRMQRENEAYCERTITLSERARSVH